MKRLIPFLFALVCASAHAVTLVQHASNRCAASTTCSVTLSGVAAGDTLILFPAGGSVAFTSLVDSNGATTQIRAWAVPSTVGAALYYEPNSASGTHIITLTTASTNQELFAAEYTGLLTPTSLDVSSVFANGSSTAPTSASITPAGNNELLVGFIVISGSSITFSSWGSSLSQVDNQAGGPSSAWAAIVQSTGVAGAASATASSSGNWLAVAAFFKPATPPTAFVISAGHALISNGKPVVVN